MPPSARLRGALAALLLAAATIGLPLALAVTVGDPLHAWPSLSAGHLSDTDLTAVLAAVFWLAWASFTLPVLVEITATVAARLRHRSPRPVRLPLLGAQQHLARHLISAALLLLLPATAATVASSAVPATHNPILATVDVTAAAWNTPAVRTTPDTAAAADGRHRDHERAARTYRIPETGGMRSYWALAEHYLGNGARWREIWQLNAGRTHADGAVMDTPRQLHAGWSIFIPAPTADQDRADPPPAPPHDVTVHPGDTLSGIAGSHGITDWRQLWEANAGRDEPDHARLTDPDLIYPGWTLRLPPTARPTPPAAGRPANPSASTPYRRPTGPMTPDPARPGAPAGAPPPTPPIAAATNPLVRQDTAAPATSSAAPDGAVERHDQQHGAGHRLPVVPLEIGLAAAAAVAVLDRARRIEQRRRRVGHRPLPPPASLRRVEADLRGADRVTHPAVAAVELATALTATSPTAVEIGSVIARDDGAVDLQLDPPRPDVPP
ncbi:MAG TPA: LysM domain-containing protein, partial [Acidimicrobiales bacterium]|nr:LysM domain-containing protein [Acidimicrobiales bacterium]